MNYQFISVDIFVCYGIISMLFAVNLLMKTDNDIDSGCCRKSSSIQLTQGSNFARMNFLCLPLEM